MSDKMNETIGALALENTIVPVIHIINNENSRRTDNEQASAAYTATTEKSGEAVPVDNIVLLTQEVEPSALLMNEEQEAQFRSAIKAGIYKSLHQKGLLTDTQLYQLISGC